MAIPVKELKRWIDTLDPSSDVAIDEGGLTLVGIGIGQDAYLEVGGEPEDDDE